MRCAPIFISGTVLEVIYMLEDYGRPDLVDDGGGGWG